MINGVWRQGRCSEIALGGGSCSGEGEASIVLQVPRHIVTGSCSHVCVCVVSLACHHSPARISTIFTR